MANVPIKTVAHDYLTVADVLGMHTVLMQMFESGDFDIAHLEPWLRSFAIAAD